MMVRIKRRESGGEGGAASSPWPDGRDPLPPVVDVDALGPTRPRPTPEPEPTSVRGSVSAEEDPYEDEAWGDGVWKPIPAASAPPPRRRPVIGPAVAEAGSAEAGTGDAGSAEASSAERGEPGDRWLALPEDMWAPASTGTEATAGRATADRAAAAAAGATAATGATVAATTAVRTRSSAGPSAGASASAAAPARTPAPPVPPVPPVEGPPIVGDGPPPRGTVSLASAALVMAAVVFLTGLLTATTGLAGDDDEVATGEPTTSTTEPADDRATSTTMLSATIPAVNTSTTGTTSVPSVGDGSGGDGGDGGTPTTERPRVTIPDRTPTTDRPDTPTTTVTTAPPVTATTAPPRPSNQPMTVQMTWDEPVVAGEDVTFHVRWTDPDAAPSVRCIEIIGDDGISIPAPDCDIDFDDCEPDPSIPPQGTTRNYSFNHSFTEAGTFDINVRNRSGEPLCGNPYASSSNERFTVNVDEAD